MARAMTIEAQALLEHGSASTGAFVEAVSEPMPVHERRVRHIQGTDGNLVVLCGAREQIIEVNVFLIASSIDNWATQLKTWRNAWSDGSAPLTISVPSGEVFDSCVLAAENPVSTIQEPQATGNLNGEVFGRVQFRFEAHAPAL